MKENDETKSQKTLKIHIFEWILDVICYTFVFILVSFLFKSFYIDTSYYGIYAVLAVIIISVLNKTIKPFLFVLTLPITGLTLGLFYPVLNVFILKLTDWILMDHFNLTNIWIAFFIAILLSIMNVLVDEIIIKPLIRRMKKNG